MTDDAPAWRRLHPASLFTRWLKFLPQMFGGGAAYAFAAQGGRSLLFTIAAAALAGLAFSILTWWRFRFAVGTAEIVIESGVLHRRRRVIPFDRVRDIALERRPIARLIGTAAVRIETGGSATDEGLLDMIALAEAHALRDHIRGSQSSLARSDGEGDQAKHIGGAIAPDPDLEPVVFAMTLGRVLLSGVFAFSLVFLALIMAALQNLDQAGLVDLGSLFSQKTAERAGLVNPRAGLILVPILIAAGLVAGVARTLLRDFGFRLTRTEKGVRRRRGLLTLSEVVIPLSRVEAASIASGAIAGRLGWHRLAFQTLGADAKEKGMQIVAPFATMDEIASILAIAGLPLPPPRERFVRVPRRALAGWVAPWLLLAAAVAAVALLVEPLAGIGATFLALLGLNAWLRWRRHGHALGADALFVRGGFLRRRIAILRFERLQTLTLSRGPLQRRLNLATLAPDSAGASALSAPELIDMDAAAAESLAAKLLTLFRERRRTAPV